MWTVFSRRTSGTAAITRRTSLVFANATAGNALARRGFRREERRRLRRNPPTFVFHFDRRRAPPTVLLGFRREDRAPRAATGRHRERLGERLSVKARAEVDDEQTVVAVFSEVAEQKRRVAQDGAVDRALAL